MTVPPEQGSAARRAGCPACWHTGRRFPFCDPSCLAYLEPCPACAGPQQMRRNVTEYPDEAKPPTISAGGVIRFFAFLPVSFVGTLLAYPLVPIAVALADREGRLPRLLQWLETHDEPGWAGPLTEPATRATYEKRGPRIGLIHWLWRNKSYRLRYWMRARVNPYMPMRESGTSTPARWGYSSWSGQIGRYFEWQPRLGLGAFHVYLRVGWKLKPIFNQGRWPEPKSPVGMFTGITPRMDDWDDYPEGPPQSDGGNLASLLPALLIAGILGWAALALWVW